MLVFLDPNIAFEEVGLCAITVCGIMKNFFKLLPDPLIPESILPGLLGIPGTNSV